MSRPTDIYLDVETDWHRNLTVVGFYSNATGVVQLVGRDISRHRLLDELPSSGRLYTFNGHSFDLSCIRNQLELDLRERYDSVDLRYECANRGLTGGQKAIEDELGFERRTAGMDGRDAIRLWNAYQAGDSSSLERLLSYNREDLDGMRFIVRALKRASGG